VISGLDDHIANTKVFHAGTTMADGELVTHGGRVLCVVGLGGSVSEAQALAYQRVDRISWRNAYCRRDIGYRAIAREQG
jgi:phosphoribosylamine--glycine ligase